MRLPFIIDLNRSTQLQEITINSFVDLSKIKQYDTSNNNTNLR